MMDISKRLFEIAAIDPKSQIGLAVKQLAEERAKDETRRQGQRDRTAKCMAKKRDFNVSLTSYPNVNLTALYTIGSTEVRKEVSKIQPRSRGSRLSVDWKLSQEDRNFALQAGFSEARVDEEAVNFIDYWIAVPGNRGLKLDWSATWRNRIRDQAKRNKPNKPKSRDVADATLDRLDAAFASASNSANGSISLGAPIGETLPHNQQRNHGGNGRLNGSDIHPISRKLIEGDLQPDDGDAFQF